MQNQERKVQQWTILNLIQWTTAYFKSHDIDTPRIDAEILLAHTLDLKRIDLYLRYDQPVIPEELTRFKRLIKRRIRREPIAYITGLKAFWTHELFVTRHVLIPRPETESLVEAALCFLSESEPMRVLELGTGSGAISIALAFEKPEHHYLASDRCTAAIQLAVKNAGHHNLLGSISYFAGDWFQPIASSHGHFDLILSNPPYIRTETMAELQPEIRQYEPRIALDGGGDGLACIQHIIQQAAFYLRPKGHLLLEMGYDQKENIQTIVDAAKRYHNVVFHKDLSGHDRVVQMEKR